jgi:catechol 2,3-dioxygenase-like lactoylglutathione lyase family enzyme
MAKLRHIAINVDNLDKDAEFYVKTFELEEVGRAGTPDMGAVYLSDGVMNIALIKISDPDYPNYNPRGLNHMGFVVDDMDKAIDRAREQGCICMVDPDDRDAGATWEMKMKMPSGVDFDFSEHGWPGITL